MSSFLQKLRQNNNLPRRRINCRAWPKNMVMVMGSGSEELLSLALLVVKILCSLAFGAIGQTEVC